MRGFFTAVGGALGAFVGGWDGFMYALVVFTVIDYMTGVFVAIKKHELSSQVGYAGICGKVTIFCLVAVGYIIDQHIICNGSVVRTAVIFFYLSNEGISILENVALLGLPVPRKLQKVLTQLREEDEDDKG